MKLFVDDILDPEPKPHDFVEAPGIPRGRYVDLSTEDRLEVRRFMTRVNISRRAEANYQAAKRVWTDDCKPWWEDHPDE